MGPFFGAFKELVSIATMIVTFPLGIINWDLKSSQGNPYQNHISERPLLLVHGYIHNGAAWLYLRSVLKKAGFQSIYTLNLGSPYHSIEEYGERIAKKVEQIKQETGKDDLILIGHSMGGLVCCYYATQLTSRYSITHIITLGSPLSGTQLAKKGVGQCARQMEYRSPFICRLQNQIKLNSSIHFLHLASKSDLIIRPTSSAAFNHKNAQVIAYPHRGHISFLYSAEVARDIIEFINNTSHL